MGISIGDTVFDAKGHPGVVVGKNEISGELVVERQGERFEKTRKRGYINGMNQAERQEFNKIIDNVKSFESQKDRVELLSKQIEELRKHPKNRVLSNYLEGEMTHIMKKEGLEPRIYSIDESKIG